MQWHSEYRYRRMFGLTHEQYLDEPTDVIQWMVRIDEAEKRAQRERERGERP